MNLFGVLTIGCIVALTSCSKESINQMSSLELEAFEEVANFTLTEADFDINEITPLVKTDKGDCYVEGALEYVKDGEIKAQVEFSKDGAVVKRNGKSDTHIDNVRRVKTSSDYSKVVIEPIVKSEDCNYIVSGVVKYYDENNNWVATVNYGDGTCDEWATKEWDGGKKQFSMDKSKYQKGGK